VAESAEAIASCFATVVIYEDGDLRGRAHGEMRELIAAAMRQVRPDVVIRHAYGADDALRQAVALAVGGAVLFIYEKLSDATAALDALGAVAWPEAEAPAHSVGDRLRIDDFAHSVMTDANDRATVPIVPAPLTVPTEPVAAGRQHGLLPGKS